MNVVTLTGRITRDPEIFYTKDNRAYLRFSLAVDRNISKESKEQGRKGTDFINCLAWEHSAEFITKYAKKGNRLGIEGKINTDDYEKDDGTKIYTTYVRVMRVELLESKPKEQLPEPEYDGNNTEEKNKLEDPFKDFGEEVKLTDEDLPF